MAGDDTKPDLLFKNVVRRPRSATSAYYTAERPRKEKPAPDGGDRPGGCISSNASVSPPATSNKRPSPIGKLVMGGGAMEKENNGGESSSPSVVGASSNKQVVKKAATDFFADKSHVVTDALRSILANLDASEPRLVYEKHMPPSDRSKGQNRLLMSCKCESRRASFASIFTDTEMPLVMHRPEPPLFKTDQDEEEEHDNHKYKAAKGRKKNKCRADDDEYEDEDEYCSSVGKEEDDDEHAQQGKLHKSMVPGLAVQAYDRDGRAYELRLKYLSSNTAYRIIGPDWTVFLEKNGLLVGGAGGVTRKRSAGTDGRRKKPRRSSLPLPDEEEPNDDEQPAAPAVRGADADDDIQMELWAFRSPKLSVGEIDQPDGALGLLLLHYHGHGGEAGVGGAAATEEEVQVVIVEQPQQWRHRARTTTWLPQEIVGGTPTRRRRGQRGIGPLVR